jgi:hypothetical protein
MINMIAVVGVDTGFTVGGGRAEKAVFIGVFALVGFMLLFTAACLCVRKRGRGHAAHDASRPF